MRQINNIPADAGHYLRREIDSTNFKNEIITAKISRNQNKKNTIFLKKDIPKDFETDETIKQNKYIKKYWTKK